MVHFLWKVGDWFPKWKGRGASFALQLFFLLDSQVIQIFRPKNCLIILRTVTYVIRGKMCFRAAMDHLGNYFIWPSS